MKSIQSMSQAELAAFIQSHLRKAGVDMVLTGGAVVTFYSKGAYISMDLDFVDQGFTSSRKLKSEMQTLGFIRSGRHYVHPDSKFFVEFVAPPLSVGHEPVDKVVEIKLATGILKALSATDCVKDRLAAYFYWNDLQSLDQALLVAKEQKINVKEVERWARKEKMIEKYKEFVAKLKRSP